MARQRLCAVEKPSRPAVEADDEASALGNQSEWRSPNRNWPSQIATLAISSSQRACKSDGATGNGCATSIDQ